MGPAPGHLPRRHDGARARLTSAPAKIWLTFGFGLARDDALALASVVVDLRVTQVVNQVLGVHAVLRDDALR